ncbi:hypothetical protein PHMEG_00034063, partial [Phytophthora megakarya]
GSDESLPSATSGSRVSRGSASGSSGWSFGIGAGAHMPFAGVMPRVMTTQETGGTVPIEGYVQTYIPPEERRRVPLEIDQHDVEMSDPEPQRKSSRPPKVERRRSHSRRSDYPEDDSDDERHRRRRRSRSRQGDVRPRREMIPSVGSKYSERTARSGRSSRSSTSGTTQVALTAIHEVKDSMAQMQKTQETLMVAMSALALCDAGNMGVKEEQESLLEDVRQQVSGSQYPEIPLAEAGHSAQDMLESRFADYQLRAENDMEAQRRQLLDEMAAFEKEFQTLLLECDQEREANKKLQSFLVGRLKKQAERQGVLKWRKHGCPTCSEKTDGTARSQNALRHSDTSRPKSDETKENVPRATTAKAATTTPVKTEVTADVRKALAEGKPRKRSVRKPDQGKQEPPKDQLKKKSTPPSQCTVKRGPPDDEPSDDDNDSDKESGDSDSDSSSFEDLASGTQPRATGQGTIMFNPMVNIKILTRSSHWLSERAGWRNIARDRHLKVFIKKLKDTQLRSTLQGQRVRSLKDLEHILKQHEEIWWSDDREAHPLKGNDRKAEGEFGNRQRQKNHSRVYNVNEDETVAEWVGRNC